VRTKPSCSPSGDHAGIDSLSAVVIGAGAGVVAVSPGNVIDSTSPLRSRATNSSPARGTAWPPPGTSSVFSVVGCSVAALSGAPTTAIRALVSNSAPLNGSKRDSVM
jgi:hypothetical protein